MLRLVDSTLARDGVAYLLAPRLRRRRLRRLITAHGLWIEREILHLPNLTSSLVLAPAEPQLLRLAVGELMSLRGWKRRAAMIVGSRRRVPTAVASTVGFVVRRHGCAPSFEWLSTLCGVPIQAAVVSRIRPSAEGFFVVFGFGEGGGRPSVVAKVMPATDAAFARESSALALLAPTARAAGAEVPEVLGSGAVGEANVLLLEPLAGSLAATLLVRSPRRLEDVLQRVVQWLLDWARLTKQPVRLTSDLLESYVLHPADLVARRIRGGAEYLAHLERLCAKTMGRQTIATAAHNDLTMWNVLVGDRGDIGVVDWEEASDGALPLMDFYYAAADAVAATSGYSDRASAFTTAFDPGTAGGRRIAGLQSRLMNELGIPRTDAKLGFHACWLHHAANEIRRTSTADAGPFVRIVESIAAMDEPNPQ